MATISAMNCPQCGAGIQSGEHMSKHSQCTYCGSMLKVTQQSTDNRPTGHRREQKYTHSGASPSPRQHCPRCHHKLASSRVGKSHLSNCYQCGGVWLPMQVLTSLKRVSRKSSAHYARLNKPRNTRQRHQSYSQHHAVHCPTCSALMQSKIYRGDHTVIVDVCAEHGVWFDARELSLAHKGARSRALRHHHERDGFLGDWAFLFQRGRRYHPAYLILRIIVEIIEEIFD